MSNIYIKKPRLRWLFGGLGFQNSEATMTGIMSEKMKNETFYKTFREVSPSFSRVFAGYADWTKESMDRFADFYDATFKYAGTTVYMVPGRMPMFTSSFNLEEYCDSVAEKLDYLINQRGLKKLRYYCVTNELSCGNTYAYLKEHLDLFKKLHNGLYDAFKRRRLDIGLLATDCAEYITPNDFYADNNRWQVKWATENMDEVTESYCAHTYIGSFKPGNLELYEKCRNVYAELCDLALKKEKRFILGEFGTKAPFTPNKVMINNVYYGVDQPQEEAALAIQIAEIALAAMNAGCLAAAQWTMFDYPDPMLRENGDTAKERAYYDTVRFSGHGLSIRYNKNGIVRWCDDEQDYSGRATLYTMGLMAKLFRKGSRVLSCDWDDENLRCGAVTNCDGSMSAAIINWAEKSSRITVNCEHKTSKPFRIYLYEAENPPFNEFNDLQSCTGMGVFDENGETVLEVPPTSMVFITTDYIDQVPSKITDITQKGDSLYWGASDDPAHCYYRVYKCGKQIASTIAEHLEVDPNSNVQDYKVYSVDRWGNCANQ